MDRIIINGVKLKLDHVLQLKKFQLSSTSQAVGFGREDAPPKIYDENGKMVGVCKKYRQISNPLAKDIELHIDMEIHDRKIIEQIENPVLMASSIGIIEHHEKGQIIDKFV